MMTAWQRWLVGGFILACLASHAFPARAQNTDYDGVWRLTFDCGIWSPILSSATVSLNGFFLKYDDRIAIENGSFSHRSDWAQRSANITGGPLPYISPLNLRIDAQQKVTITFTGGIPSSAGNQMVANFSGAIQGTSFAIDGNVTYKAMLQNVGLGNQQKPCNARLQALPISAASSIQATPNNRTARDTVAAAAPAAAAQAQQPSNLRPAQTPPPDVSAETPAQREERQRFRSLPLADMRAIQAALQASGFYRSAIDGIYGPGMEAAISAWQRRHGATPTSFLTPAQIVALRQQQAAAEAAPAPTPTPPVPSAPPAAAPSVTVQAQQPRNHRTAQPSSADAPSETPAQREERQRFYALPIADMRAIQAALQAGGFNLSAIDGIYSPGMEAAIIAWQSRLGVSQTGFLTPAQIVALRQQQAAAEAAPAPTPLPTPTPPLPSAPVLATPPSTDPAAGLRGMSVKAQLRDKFAPRIGTVDAERLFMGNDGDILLFSNEYARAPHFFRRVTGDGAFRDNKMVVCSVGNVRNMDDVFARYATRALLKAVPDVAPQSPTPWNTSCGALAANSQNDLLAVLRSDLINYPTLQDQLIAAMTAKYLRWFNQIDRSPFDILLAQREANARQLTAQMRAGTLDGMGLLATPTANTAVCATKAHDGEYVKRLVADINLGILVDKKPGEDPKIFIAEIDDVFVYTKRDQCGFVFGDGATLKLMSEAFERDGFAVSLVPVIVPKDKADALLAQLQSERAVARARVTNDQTEQARLAQDALRRQQEQQAAELQQQAQRQAALDQQQALEQASRRNDEAARREELARMRNVVASRGRALQDGLDARLRKHMVSVVQEVRDTKVRAQLGQVLSEQQQRELQVKYAADRLEREFPTWAQQLSKSVKEEWELGDIKASPSYSARKRRRCALNG